VSPVGSRLFFVGRPRWALVSKVQVATALLLMNIACVPFAQSDSISNITANLPPLIQPECVILLHGLARTRSSMEEMQEALQEAGYRVVNYDYPSREKTIEELAGSVIPAALAACDKGGPVTTIHFVTHSLGGILVRYFLSQQPIDKLGRVVMLSPPNQGSEVINELGDMPGFYWLNGPAGQQLGTESDSVPNSLGPADFPLGIITGDRSINLILSTLIPGPDDGKVSIEDAKLEGMTDFLVVHHSHPFIMEQELVIEQTIYFLRQGRFYWADL